LRDDAIGMEARYLIEEGGQHAVAPREGDISVIEHRIVIIARVAAKRAHKAGWGAATFVRQVLGEVVAEIETARPWKAVC